MDTATLKQPHMAEQLNSVQLMLLNVFAGIRDEKEKEEITQLLYQYYATKLHTDTGQLPKHALGNGLAGMRGILKAEDNTDTTYDDMRREAINEKYGLSL